ncbi:hypothetical protein SteCoe_13792 [Stentor coeruleus]|uniref:Uncharacterized protein n=1 Tax=Stentor coeruleus TaxID=5963 RepID=A0A1R2C7K0_9CILI|nr:hypothetical protein SteCoe_13792 [Stentor coeruleus]
MQVRHHVACNSCSSFALFYCQICKKHFSCQEHKNPHCGKQMLDCPKSFNRTFVLKKIAEAEILKKIIEKIIQETIEKLNKIVVQFMDYTRNVCNELTDEYKNVWNTVNDNAGVGLEFINVGSPWALTYFCDDLASNMLTDEYKEKVMKYDKICKDIESLLDRKSLDDKCSKDKIRGNVKNYTDLDGEVVEKWRETKKHNPNKVVDAFSDLIMHLEDNKNKILTEEIKITRPMTQVPGFNTFVSNLPDICPNLKKISIESSPLCAQNILQVLPRHKNLIDLSFDFLLKPTSNTGINLETLNSLPNIQRLVFKNVFLIDANSHQIPNLKILELVKNGITPNNHASLCDFIKRNKSIKYLKISKNDLRHQVAMSLDNALSELKTLEYLSLSENTCDLALREVIKGLRVQQSVIELQVYMNDIPEGFWEECAEEFVWPRLKILVLGFGVNEHVVKNLAKKTVDVFFRNNHYFVPIKDMIS